MTAVPAHVLVAATGAPPLIHRGPAQRLARRELARSMYRPSWWERVVHAINRWLNSTLGSLSPGHAGWWTLVVLIIVVVLVIVGIVAWIGPARRSRRRREAAVLGTRPLSAAEHRRAAERLAGDGDYAGAIVERMRALAVDLEARGILTQRPGRTASELAGEAAAALGGAASRRPDGAGSSGGDAPQGMAGALRAAARLFDDVRYGGRAGTRAGYAQIRDLDTAIAEIRTPQATLASVEPAAAGAGATAAAGGAGAAGPAGHGTGASA